MVVGFEAAVADAGSNAKLFPFKMKRLAAMMMQTRLMLREEDPAASPRLACS